MNNESNVGNKAILTPRQDAYTQSAQTLFVMGMTKCFLYIIVFRISTGLETVLYKISCFKLYCTVSRHTTYPTPNPTYISTPSHSSYSHTGSPRTSTNSSLRTLLPHLYKSLPSHPPQPIPHKPKETRGFRIWRKAKRRETHLDERRTWPRVLPWSLLHLRPVWIFGVFVA